MRVFGIILNVLHFDLPLLHKILWENRFRNYTGKTCLVTVDGTDFLIVQPIPFSKRWYTQKFHGPGLRYEVAICIQTGDIVWISGPFRPGKMNDITIFRKGLKYLLLDAGEMAEADKGYRGEPNCIRLPGDYVSLSDKRAKDNARGRHETVNRRLKTFGCLQQRFRHAKKKHKYCFAAVAVCVQLAFENGELPFQVTY